MGDRPEFLHLNRDELLHYESCTVNEYTDGSGISPHIDSLRFSETIMVLSLIGTAVMRFELDKEWWEETLNPTDLVIMSGEARLKWTHAVLPNTGPRRLSVVYRHRKK